MDRSGGDEGDGVEVGVGEHDAGGLPAELEDRRLEGLRAAGEDRPGGGGPAGEADLLHQGVVHERLAGLCRAGHDVDDACRDAGLADQVHEQLRGVGGELGGLHHDGVAGRQGGDHLHPHRDERTVPGDDDPDDAVRLGDGVRELSTLGGRRGDPALDLVSPTGVVPGVVHERAGRELGDAQGHAVVEDRQPRQFVLGVVEELGQLHQHVPALPGGPGSPGRERRVGRLHGIVDVIDAGEGHGTLHLPRGRVPVGVLTARAGGPAFVADVQVHLRHGPIDGHSFLRVLIAWSSEQLRK